MKITESKLRRIIRSVIKEGMEVDMGPGYSDSEDDNLDFYDNEIESSITREEPFDSKSPPFDPKQRGSWTQRKKDLDAFLKQGPSDGGRGFNDAYHSQDARIHRMHDLYKLDKSEDRIAGGDEENKIKWHVHKQFNFQHKHGEMRGLDEDISKILLSYNASNYYDKSKDDVSKLNLMVSSFDNQGRSSEETLHKILNAQVETKEISDSEVKENQYQISDDRKGIRIFLYKTENDGSSIKKTATLNFSYKPDIVGNLEKFLNKKGFKKIK